MILAHNYQLPWIQDVADHVGDKLALSRIAASSDAATIVFCGVHFMAETAKILAPDRTVLLPAKEAGCSLADSITAEQLIAWKAQNPGAVVVSYVNTLGNGEGRIGYLLRTSSNAVEVVRVDSRGYRDPVPPRLLPGQSRREIDWQAPQDLVG